MDKIKENAKAIAALVVAVVTAVPAAVITEPWNVVASVAVAIAGAVIVWATPNKVLASKTTDDLPEEGHYTGD